MKIVAWEWNSVFIEMEPGPSAKRRTGAALTPEEIEKVESFGPDCNGTRCNATEAYKAMHQKNHEAWRVYRLKLAKQKEKTAQAEAMLYSLSEGNERLEGWQREKERADKAEAGKCEAEHRANVAAARVEGYEKILVGLILGDPKPCDESLANLFRSNHALFTKANQAAIDPDKGVRGLCSVCLEPVTMQHLQRFKDKNGLYYHKECAEKNKAKANGTT